MNVNRFVESFIFICGAVLALVGVLAALGVSNPILGLVILLASIAIFAFLISWDGLA